MRQGTLPVTSPNVAMLGGRPPATAVRRLPVGVRANSRALTAPVVTTQDFCDNL